MWISDLLRLPKKVQELQQKIEKEMKMAQVNFDALSAKVAAQGDVITAISGDYTTMKQQIAALQTAVDANDPVAIQAKIDALARAVDESNARLVTLDESVPPPAPPTP